MTDDDVAFPWVYNETPCLLIGGPYDGREIKYLGGEAIYMPVYEVEKRAWRYLYSGFYCDCNGIWVEATFDEGG